MRDTKYGLPSRAAHQAALATGLCITALGASCGPQAPLPDSQPKVAAARTQSLLGADMAGTITAANTVINTYAKLAADAKVGDNAVTVASAAALNLKAGDLIMVTQMQGAVLETSDTAGVNGYGLVKTLSGAGNYEIASVKSVDVTTGVITLDHCSGLKNAYTAAGHAQVVRVPQYTTLDIKTGGSITALPWDGDKGGVVAAYVQGKTTLTGNIDASATGFRGGASTNGAQNPGQIITTYRSTAVNDSGEHGEGIGGFEKEYDNLGGRYGRGAPANGGGGGNSHNAGGGGGANNVNGSDWTGQGVMSTNPAFMATWSLDPGYKANANKLTTSSGGGRGGYTYSTNLQSTAVKGPGDSSWGGNNRQEVGGLGGRPLNNNAKTALFLGGGGGAGNGNDGIGFAGAGGRGGGMIFLVTGSIEGAGSILAKGSAGDRTKVGTTGSDAPGGGGAGGTVVVLVGRQLGNAVKLAADGGVGGSQFITNVNEAEGPGGGGGGGYIATFTPPQLPTIATRSVAGAASGVTDSNVMTLFNVNGATLGADGKADATYTYSDGTQMPVCVPSDLAVSTTLTKGQVSPGSTAEFTVVLTNLGPEPAQAVGINDTFGGGGGAVTWTCVASGGATCPAAMGTGPIASIADLPVQGTLTYVVKAVLPAAFTGPLTYDVGAIVPPGFNDLKLGNNNPSLSLPSGTLPTADLAISLTSTPNPVAGGQPIVYDVGVQNNGPGTAAGASFTYTVPAGSTIQNITAPPSWSCPQPAPQATAVVCTYVPPAGTIGVPPGVLPNVKITVLPPVGSTDIMSSATVTGVGVTDPTPGNNTATNDTPVGTFPTADIIVGVNSTPNPAPQGGPVSYDVRVTNAGPSTATGASVSFDVPPGSTIQSFDNSATGWACTAVLTKVSCTYAQSFPPGTLPPVVITVLPDPLASSINVTAQGSGSGIIDPNLGNNTAAEIDPIGGTPPQADLVLTVTTAPTEPRRNVPVVYNLDIANKGPGAATGAVLTYNIPSGGTVQSIVAPDGWNCAQLTNPSQVSCWYNGTIAANSSAPGVQITILPGSGTGQLDTQATVTPKGAVDPNTMDNTVATTTSLLNYKLDGGGFGCSAVPGGGVPAAGAGLLGTLLGLLGLRRRRR